MSDYPWTGETKRYSVDEINGMHRHIASLREHLEQAETKCRERIKAERLHWLKNGDEFAQQMAERLEQAEARAEACKQEAQSWKQEARTQSAIVGDIYQTLTGKSGEPGDWNGVRPVKAAILRKQAEAVAQVKYEHALSARIPDGTAGENFQDGFDSAAEQYDDAIDRYAQRLRQQADELEKGDSHE